MEKRKKENIVPTTTPTPTTTNSSSSSSSISSSQRRMILSLGNHVTINYIVLFALAGIVMLWSSQLTRSLHALDDKHPTFNLPEENASSEKKTEWQEERIQELERSLQERKSQNEAFERSLLQLQAQLDKQSSQTSQSQTQSQTQTQQLPKETNILPTCVELMNRPHSPYADGYFITRHTTSHTWKPRRDDSRQFEIDTCQLKRYTADEARECLANQHVNFIGDSLTRYQFFSLAHLLDKGRYPPRFGLPSHGGTDNCTHIDENGLPQCSPPGQPNLCMEGDWRFGADGKESWTRLFSNIGGGDDGGMFQGRMECSCARRLQVENQIYVSPSFHNNHRTVLSVFQEVGWTGMVKPIQGFAFTGCAFNATCRSSYEQTVQRELHNGTMDFEQYLVDAIHPHNGSLVHMLPPPNITIYNRGLWGLLEEDKAKQVFPLFYNWTGREQGRCFYRSTTGAPKTFAQTHTHEVSVIRDIAFEAGCSFLDYGHITRDFAALKYTFPQPPRQVGGGKLSNDDERRSVYWDRVHFHPWVYEELNNVLFNVLCNHQAKRV